MDLIKRLFTEEEGQGLTEYALILAAIVIVGVVVSVMFNNSITNIFTNTKNKIDAAVS